MDKFNFRTGSFQPDNNDVPSPAQSDNKKSLEAAEKKRIIQDFGSYTTLHGLHFVIESAYYGCRRLIWLFLLTGGFVCFFLQVKISFDKLNAKEVFISKSVDFAQELPFPSVTICNQNMMRKSQIMGTVAQDYLDQLDSIRFRITHQKPKDVTSFDVEKTLKKAGHQIKDMIFVCEFSGKDCLKNKDLAFVPTRPSATHGLCYTFTANRSALNKVGPGKYDGLLLRLNAEPYEYYGPYSYDATGFKIVIHEPGSAHDIDNVGYDISPGFYTSMRLKRKKTIRQPPPYPSKCGSRKLDNFDHYTQKACLIECWSKTMATECDCRMVGMVNKGIEDLRFCNSTEVRTCIGPASKKFTGRYNANTCGCPAECESIYYDVQMSMAYNPSETLVRNFIPFLNKNFTRLKNASDPQQMEKIQMEIRKIFATISIFFPDVSTDVTEEKRSYEKSDFAVDIGGNMGLFLGCSLLTIFEFVDLMIMLCFNRLRKRTVRVDDH